MILESYELANAVVFFEERRILRSMLYAEFEAILDGYVPAVEFANQQCEAAYIEINSSFQLATAVFFRVSFGRKGEVDSAWKLPLEQLASMADSVPDTRLGHFRMASFSQCPIRYFQDYLWQPDFDKGNHQVRALQHFAKDNRLAIRFRSAAPVSGSAGDKPLLSDNLADDGSAAVKASREQAMQEAYAEEFKAQLKSLQLQAVLAKRESDELIAKLKKDHEQRIGEYRSLFKEQDRQMKALREDKHHLQNQLQEKEQKLVDLRTDYEEKLREAEIQERELADSLYDNLEKEIRAMLEADSKEYKELLRMREFEIHNRKQEEISLKSEVAALRQQNQDLKAGKGAELLHAMASKGLSFVNYQPGTGNLNVPAEDVFQFMENPPAYVAQQCGVCEASYQSWLRHYRAPVCVATDGEGQLCGENIERCESPSQFQSGITDRCGKHQVFGKGGKLKVVAG